MNGVPQAEVSCSARLATRVIGMSFAVLVGSVQSAISDEVISNSTFFECAQRSSWVPRPGLARSGNWVPVAADAKQLVLRCLMPALKKCEGGEQDEAKLIQCGLELNADINKLLHDEIATLQAIPEADPALAAEMTKAMAQIAEIDVIPGSQRNPFFLLQLRAGLLGEFRGQTHMEMLKAGVDAE